MLLTNWTFRIPFSVISARYFICPTHGVILVAGEGGTVTNLRFHEAHLPIKWTFRLRTVDYTWEIEKESMELG